MILSIPKHHLQIMLNSEKLSFIEKLLYINLMLLALENYVINKNYSSQIAISGLSKMLNIALDSVLQNKKKLVKKDLLKVKKNFSIFNTPSTDTFFPQKPSISDLNNTDNVLIKINSKSIFKLFATKKLKTPDKIIMLALLVESKNFKIFSNKKELLEKFRVHRDTLNNALKKLELLKMLRVLPQTGKTFEIQIKEIEID